MGDRKKNKKDLEDLDVEQQEAAEVKGGVPGPHGHHGNPHVHAPSVQTKKARDLKKKIDNVGGSTRIDG